MMFDSKIYQRGYNNAVVDFQRQNNLRGRNVVAKSPLVKLVEKQRHTNAKKVDDPKKVFDLDKDPPKNIDEAKKEGNMKELEKTQSSFSL